MHAHFLWECLIRLLWEEYEHDGKLRKCKKCQIIAHAKDWHCLGNDCCGKYITKCCKKVMSTLLWTKIFVKNITRDCNVKWISKLKLNMFRRCVSLLNSCGKSGFQMVMWSAYLIDFPRLWMDFYTTSEYSGLNNLFFACVDTIISKL